MNFVNRLGKRLKSWWQSNEELPREPPVPGRPGGQVGNTRPIRSAGEAIYPSQGGETS